MSKPRRTRPSRPPPRPSDSDRTGPDRAFWLAASLIFLVVLVAFWPTLNNGFVNWGDRSRIVEDPEVRGIGPRPATRAFAADRIGSDLPMARIIRRAGRGAWGLDPRAYHAASLVLHGLNAIALAALAIALIGRRRPAMDESARGDVRTASAVAAIAFAVHPLRVEAVAWATGQPDLMASLCAILATLAYLKAHPNDGPADWRWLVGSVGLLALAALSETSAVGLPLVLLILDVYPLGRIGPGRWRGPAARRIYLEKLPFAGLSGVALVLAIAAREGPSGPAFLPELGPLDRLARACYGASFILFQTVLPLDLTVAYTLPKPVAWFEPPYLLSLGFVAGLSALLIRTRRRWPAALAAWSAYLAVLLPEFALAGPGDPIGSDRSSYIATVGPAVLLAAALARPASAVARRRLLTSAFGGALLLLGLTLAQCRAWHDSTTLWRHALAHGGGAGATPYDGLGRLAAGRRDHEEAARWFGQAIAHEPGDAEAHNGLGTALVGLGRLDQAAREFAEAVRLRPDFAEARNNYGLALARRQLFAEAAYQFQVAIRLDSGLIAARRNFEDVQRRLQWQQHDFFMRRRAGAALAGAEGAKRPRVPARRPEADDVRPSSRTPR